MSKHTYKYDSFACVSVSQLVMIILCFYDNTTFAVDSCIESIVHLFVVYTINKIIHRHLETWNLSSNQWLLHNQKNIFLKRKREQNNTQSTNIGVTRIFWGGRDRLRAREYSSAEGASNLGVSMGMFPLRNFAENLYSLKRWSPS